MSFGKREKSKRGKSSRSKRGKSKGRSKDTAEETSNYGPADGEVQSAGFFPMLFGMILTLMFIFYVVSLLNPQAADPQLAGKQRRDPAGQDLGASTFEQFLKVANADQMVGRLNDLKETRVAKLSPERVAQNRQRAVICQRLLEMDIPEKYRTLAKVEWMSAVKMSFGIDFIGKLNSPDVAEEFEVCFSQFLNDTDSKVHREAHLSRLSFVLFECVKGNRAADEVWEVLNEVLEKFPDDDEAQANIRLQFQACVETDINLAKQLAEEVLREDSGRSGKVAGFAQYVLDNYQIIDLKYGDLFVNRFVNGEAGLRELEKTSLQLLDNPDSGLLVAQQVANVAFWYERDRRFDSASRIFDAMREAGKVERKDSEATKLLVKVGESGVKRMSLVGKRIVIEGTTASGKEIKNGDFDSRVVLVCFFQPKSKASMLLVRRLERAAKRYAQFGSPVRVVGVPVSDESYKTNLSSGVAQSRVHFFDWHNGEPPEILKNYPVSNFPHLMALSHRGELVRVNIDPKVCEAEIDKLVDLR